jgi:hypothetical protein
MSFVELVSVTPETTTIQFCVAEGFRLSVWFQNYVDPAVLLPNTGDLIPNGRRMISFPGEMRIRKFEIEIVP